MNFRNNVPLPSYSAMIRSPSRSTSLRAGCAVFRGYIRRAVDGPGNPPAQVVVGVGGHRGIVGVVDVGQAAFAVVVVAELAVEGEIAVVVVGIGRARDGGVLVEVDD
jgi:hypothetical protein